MLTLYVLIIGITALTQCKASLNVHNRMYVRMDATSPCVLRLNGTQSSGCTSSREGNVGVIHLAENLTDLKWVFESSPMDSYIICLTLDMFTMANLLLMHQSPKVSGVLLMLKSTRDKVPPFSTDDQCPNRYSNNKDVCDKPWNLVGSGIMQRSWNIPIFFTNDQNITKTVEDCFRKYNLPLNYSQTDRSLCALEMKSHMFAAVDSRTCIRRSYLSYNMNPVGFCDPLRSQNIYVPIIPFINFKSKPYIVVAARLDATSLFYHDVPGALATASSLVTLILTAKLLFQFSKNTDLSQSNRNILFVFFNGEAYDYIGSSRIVYDMQNGDFPYKEKAISIDDIELFVELSQLLNVPQITYFSDKISPQVNSFVTNFNTISKNKFNLTPSNRSSTIPPSSFQSFLKKKSDLSGLVLGSYDDHYINQYYHSVFDDNFNINYEYANGSTPANNSLANYVASFSTTLAQTLFQMLSTVTPTESITPIESDQVLHCFVENVNCDYIKLTGDPSRPPIKPNYFVGVGRQVNELMDLAKGALITFMSNNLNITDETQCLERMKNSAYNYIFTDDKQCLETPVNVSDALSPAFLIPDYDMTSGTYSTWTESTWRVTEVRMFMQPSRSHEWLVCVTGLLILVSSFAVTFWIKTNAEEVFDYPNIISI